MVGSTRRALRCVVAASLLGAPALPATLADSAPAGPSAPAAAQLPIVPDAGPQFFAISVRDVDASARFYRKVFGLATKKELKPGDGGYRVLILGSDRLVVELGHGRDFRIGEDPLRRHLVAGVFKVGFYVTDLSLALRALAEHGISPVVGPFVEKDLGIRSAVIHDNEGNAIQLFERLR